MINIRSAILLLMFSLAATSSAAPAGPRPRPDVERIWPVSASADPDLPQSSTFGPRLKASENYRYDWHRGIDIPTPLGAPVVAISDGVVRLAGDYPFYSDSLIVQVGHLGEVGEPDYYANYLHLTGIEVSEDDPVVQGQVLGYSGAPDSGFPHLHFEIREGGAYQKNCVHPWRYLPHDNSAGQSILIEKVNLGAPLQPIVKLFITAPPNKLDVNRVELRLFDLAQSWPGELIDSQVFDMEEWTFSTDEPELLDEPDLFGILVEPEAFNSESETWQLSLTFHDLIGAEHLRIVATVTDTEGNSVNDTWVHRPHHVELAPR